MQREPESMGEGKPVNALEQKVIVIGGGIAGLTCAWRLMKNSVPVELFEADTSAGGNVRTATVNGFLLERGPHTFMASADDVFQLAAEVGLDQEVVASRPSAHRRFIARHGKLHAMPSGPWSFLRSELLSFQGKLKLLGEPFRTRRGLATESATEFFNRRFGPEASRVLAGAFISGVYAGDPDRLSAPAAFPLFWEFEREHGSMIRGALHYRRRRQAERRAMGIEPGARRGLYSFCRGLGQLTGAVSDHLGARVHLAHPVRDLAKRDGAITVVTDRGAFSAGRVVLAVPPHEAARLVRGMDAALADLLASIPMAPVAVVHQGYLHRAQDIPDGFGFLAPRGEGIETLGVLFPSRLFHGRALDGGDVATGYIGGMLNVEAMQKDDRMLSSIVGGELSRLTGSTARPDLVQVTRHPNAIPQFTLGHLVRMGQAHARLEHIPGLFLAGNYLKGVGMKDAVRSGFEVSARIVAEIRNR